VSLEAVGVELGAKPGLGDSINAGAIEVQSYADAPDSELDGSTHEELLRERHDQKDDMLSELQRRTQSRRDAADAGVAAGGLLDDDPQAAGGLRGAPGGVLDGGYLNPDPPEEDDDARQAPPLVLDERGYVVPQQQ